MDKIKSCLQEWIIDFIKSRDAIFKRLVSIEKDKENCDVFAKYNDKDQHILVEPILANLQGILAKLEENKHYGLVVLNTKLNLDELIKNWQSLIKFKFLTIYFINPFSQLDKKWIIVPYVHNRICDESSLKTGLKSMFDMVDPLTEQDIASKF